MIRVRLSRRLRTRRGLALVLAVIVVLAAAVVAIAVNSAANIRTVSRFVAGTPEGSTPVRLDTTLYLPEHTPAPAVLLAHGFGGTKDSVAGQARTLAEHGYVVLTYTARGFGRSGGLIHLDAPGYEVHDASLLVDYLSTHKSVEAGKIGVAGASYGGGLALLLAGTDKRIKAVAADITWNDLRTALFPNGAAANGPYATPGVFKKLWAGYLFQNGFGSVPDIGSVSSALPTSGEGGTAAPANPEQKDSSQVPAGLPAAVTSPECGRFAADICAGYQRAAATGRPDAALLALLQASSPSTVLGKITAPTLLSQGEQDSLFPLSEADANARGIAAHGTPVKVVWRTGGHDDPSAGSASTGQLESWFDDAFAGRIHGRQPFQLSERGAAISSTTGRVHRQTIQATGYPGIEQTPRRTRSIDVAGPTQTIAQPAGGNPASVNAIPVLGALLGAVGGGVVSLPSTLSLIPGQTAAFVSAPLAHSTLVAGSSAVTIDVTAKQAGDAVLFAALRDVGSGNSITLPSQLVQPLVVPGMKAGETRSVTVDLPSIVRTVPAHDRVVLTITTTDLGYSSPSQPHTYAVALAGGQASITVPTESGPVVRSGGHPLAWLLIGLGIALLSVLGVAFELRRRRRIVHREPELAAVPVAITSLVKEYAGGYRAVDDVTFRVEAGQVVGLLGPNGAGKTTTLRVLVGLITPTSGTVHVFGEPVLPGAAVLARLGAFIEGPGFLPHLSGRENLELYWAATGRPAEEADFDTALQIAGLGASVDRRVRQYSQGMRQRLGIAQAMLGLPELLVLDEPTNGLDPPQIAEMREVLQSYARTGRTVVVSSHLLAEVEQTCTHVVVMHKGRLVATGSVAEIAGSGGQQLAVADPRAAAEVLTAAGITAELVPARRALEDVFLDLIGSDQ
jgi:ABC-2 type transport system ATP-binding protein